MGVSRQPQFGMALCHGPRDFRHQIPPGFISSCDHPADMAAGEGKEHVIRAGNPEHFLVLQEMTIQVIAVFRRAESFRRNKFTSSAVLPGKDMEGDASFEQTAEGFQ